MAQNVKDIIEKLRKSKQVEVKAPDQDFEKELEETRKKVEAEMPKIQPKIPEKVEKVESDEVDKTLPISILHDNAFYRNQKLAIESKIADNLEAIVLLLSKLLEWIKE